MVFGNKYVRGSGFTRFGRKTNREDAKPLGRKYSRTEAGGVFSTKIHHEHHREHENDQEIGNFGMRHRN